MNVDTKTHIGVSTEEVSTPTVLFPPRRDSRGTRYRRVLTVGVVTVVPEPHRPWRVSGEGSSQDKTVVDVLLLSLNLFKVGSRNQVVPTKGLSVPFP